MMSPIHDTCHDSNLSVSQLTPQLFIKKGTRIDMPIWASHHNPEFFPEPEEFRPERFLKENADQILPYTYRPFGGKFS